MDKVFDSTGIHDGFLVGTKARQVKGPVCCGTAIRFSETNASTYIVIPDSSEFDLDSGSISFWIQVGACPAKGQGVLSRDARLTEKSGHFGVRLFPDCDLSVHLQTNADEVTNEVEVYSSQSLVPGIWTKVIINFGPPDLELFFDNKVVGQRSVDWGIDGNDNPWVFGADSRYSEEGTDTPPADFLQGVAIDLIRISSERQQPTDVQ